MIKELVRKYTSITIKLILILLMLNLSSLFLTGQTTAAVGSLAGGYVSGSGGETSEEDVSGGGISAGLDPVNAPASQPVDANVIVLPDETGLEENAPGEPSDQDGSSKPAGEPGSAPDELQSEAGSNPSGAEGTAANSPEPKNPSGSDSLSGNEGAASGTDPQPTRPAQGGSNTGTQAGGEPVPGEGAESDAAALMQAVLDKVYRHEGEKVAYLTFDDGPVPSLTSAVLDILKAENVKATFFMIGSNAERYPDMVRRQYEEGHGIGNHTYSHVFKEIYSSPESFTNDLSRSEQVLKSILGEDKEFKLIRFPGGSFGKALAPFREAANQAGYFYVDWNSLNGDAETSKGRTAKQLVNRLKETVTGQSGLVVLMHDAPNKQTTIEALPEIIQFLRSENYRFELLPGSR